MGEGVVVVTTTGSFAAGFAGFAVGAEAVTELIGAGNIGGVDKVTEHIAERILAGFCTTLAGGFFLALVVAPVLAGWCRVWEILQASITKPTIQTGSW